MRRSASNASSVITANWPPPSTSSMGSETNERAPLPRTAPPPAPGPHRGRRATVWSMAKFTNDELMERLRAVPKGGADIDFGKARAALEKQTAKAPLHEG